MSDLLRSAILGLLVATMLAGCGGAKKIPQPGEGDGNVGELKPRAIHGEPAQNPAAPIPVVQKPVVPPQPPPKPAEPTQPAIDPSTDPRDIFEVAAAAPIYVLAGDSLAASSADAFAVVRPPAGRTSNDFQYAAGPPTETSSIKSDGATKTDGAPDGPKNLPEGFTAIPSAGVSRFGWPARIRCARDGAEMAFVAGGAVVVGRDGGPRESSPQVTVVLDSFYMDVTEVTLGQYQRFREAAKAEKGHSVAPEAKNAESPPDYPVLAATLIQAQFYARWAGKELPTEAEWERAARGESSFDHPWGNGRAIWKTMRRPDDIGAVKSHRTDVSPFGIYDLAGNAREWCVDRYSATAFAEALKATPAQLRNWKGPRNANPANHHVVKGNGPNWDAWHRAGVNGAERSLDIGFRCVLRLSAKSR